MKILMIGDVVADPGIKALQQVLGQIKNDYDFIIANAENSAPDQKGITIESAQAMLAAGCDVLTSGNHYVTKDETWSHCQELNLVRPANYDCLGQDYCNVNGVTVMNFSGMIMPANPGNLLEAVDNVLRQPDLETIKIVDFHAVSPYEAKALGYYLANKVSMVAGTHTHTPTADQQILDGFTGFVGDLGMVGVYNSILGYEIDKAIQANDKGGFSKSTVAVDDNSYIFNGVAVEVDPKTGQALTVNRVDYRVVDSVLQPVGN